MSKKSVYEIFDEVAKELGPMISKEEIEAAHKCWDILMKQVEENENEKYI